MIKLISRLFSKGQEELYSVTKVPSSIQQSVVDKIKVDVIKNINSQVAQKQFAFHKTAVDEVESKDVFLGVSKPICKQIAQQYSNAATFSDISILLKTPSNEHELKLVACLILINKVRDTAKPNNAKLAYDFYFKHLVAFTSWDLIDETAPIIIGGYLQMHHNYPRDDLYRLIKSRSDWDKRIALAATEPFIADGDFNDALELCKLCFNELSPMVLKTAGKLLKEIGRKHKPTLFEFLAHNQTKMPKVMLNAAMGNLAQGLKKTIRTETKLLNKR